MDIDDYTGWIDDDEYSWCEVLEAHSSTLKSRDDEVLAHLPPYERPATLNQLFACNIIDIDSLFSCSLEQLSELCAKFTRKQLAEVINKRIKADSQWAN